METINYKEFEPLLQKMKERLESNIAQLTDEVNALGAEDDISDMEDLASLKSDSMHHNALLKQQKNELEEVIHALSKLKNGTYGICETSGNKISIERLRAKPHARYCLREAKKME